MLLLGVVVVVAVVARSGVVYEEYTPEQQEALKREVRHARLYVGVGVLPRK